MKFCKHCGRQLEDNASCTCEGALKEQVSVQQTQQYVQQSPVNQSPYAVTGSSVPSGQGKAAKALKNTPVIFMSFWKNLRQTVNVAKETKDIAVAIVYSAIFFISALLFNIFAPLSVDNMLKPLLGGIGVSVLNFSVSLLVALLLLISIGGLFTLILFLQEKIFNKNPDTQKSFINSFISFSILSIPASIGFVVAGICSFISYYLMIAVLTFTIIYLILALVTEIKNIVTQTDNTKFILLNALFITVSIIIVVFVCLWASGVLGILNLMGSAMNSTMSSAMSGLSGLGSLFG